jgi:flagellar biogenesis protein FliO
VRSCEWRPRLLLRLLAVLLVLAVGWGVARLMQGHGGRERPRREWPSAQTTDRRTTY